jgi:hypothetical protein
MPVWQESAARSHAMMAGKIWRWRSRDFPTILSMSAGGQLQRQPRTRRQQANRDRMHEYRLTWKAACDSRVGRGANEIIAWVLHHE